VASEWRVAYHSPRVECGRGAFQWCLFILYLVNGLTARWGYCTRSSRHLVLYSNCNTQHHRLSVVLLPALHIRFTDDLLRANKWRCSSSGCRWIPRRLVGGSGGPNVITIVAAAGASGAVVGEFLCGAEASTDSITLSDSLSPG
jgi:hypothetical protein